MVAATQSCSFGPNASYVRAPALPLTGTWAWSTAARIAAFSSELPHHEDGCVAVVLDELMRKLLCRATPRSTPWWAIYSSTAPV
jgi:hypothetical protein